MISGSHAEYLTAFKPKHSHEHYLFEVTFTLCQLIHIVWLVICRSCEIDKTERGISSPVSLGKTDEAVKCWMTKQKLHKAVCILILFLNQTAYTSKTPHFNRERSHKSSSKCKIHKMEFYCMKNFKNVMMGKLRNAYTKEGL